MLKRTLIALEEYDYSKVAIDYGIQLATGCDCELVGLSVIDIPSIEKSIGPVPAGGTYYARKEEKLKKEDEVKIAAELIHEFETRCREKKINFKIYKREGNPADVIIEESKYHDLVILGWKTSFRYGASEDKRLHHQIISHGICPVLIIPQTYRDIKKILLCYDGKDQSAKAIHQFLQFNICRTKQFVLLHVNQDSDHGEQLLAKMGEYLTSWNINYEKVCLKGHPKTVISQYIKKNNIDMLVLGAHGHQGIAGFFFGSTAQNLITHADHPLFIFH